MGAGAPLARRAAPTAAPERRGGCVRSLPPAARHAVERAWLRVLSGRHPELAWHLIRPDVGLEGHTMAATGEVVRAFAVPEDHEPLLDRNLTAAAPDRTHERGVDASA